MPWWPGSEDSPWRQGPHRLNAAGEVDLALPAGGGSTPQWLSRLRGRAQLTIEPSRLAGVPLSGQAALQSADEGRTEARLQLLAAGNELRADARLDRPAEGSGDQWQLKADLPALKKLQPLWKLLLPAGSDARLGGTLRAEARVDGRWPALSTQGQLDAQQRSSAPCSCSVPNRAGRWIARRRAAGPAAGADAAVPHGAPSPKRVTLQLRHAAVSCWC